jgi:hypothetical protein
LAGLIPMGRDYKDHNTISVAHSWCGMKLCSAWPSDLRPAIYVVKTRRGGVVTVTGTRGVGAAGIRRQDPTLSTCTRL